MSLRIKAYYGQCDCGAYVDLTVCSSVAGKYAGGFCENCGPYDRMSWYMNTTEEVEQYIRSTAHAEDEELSED